MRKYERPDLFLDDFSAAAIALRVGLVADALQDGGVGVVAVSLGVAGGAVLPRVQQSVSPMAYKCLNGIVW